VTAAERWADALGQWALPDEVLAAATDSPWVFPVGAFLDLARDALTDPRTPTHRRVVDALPLGGVLLDVGSGAGAASLPVAPPAGRIVAVDQDPRMLAALRSLAAAEVVIDAVPGRWPDVHEQVPVADVVVCANVAYNVADLAPFVVALTTKARRRVVLELTDAHPQAPLSPLWRQFWNLSRPTRPVADDAIAVIREALGIDPHVERWSRPRSILSRHGADAVPWTRRRLCLPPERDAEVAAALAALFDDPRSAVVTVWWRGAARSQPRPGPAVRRSAS
jgi:SAM-dependent methyltransferase